MTLGSSPTVEGLALEEASNLLKAYMFQKPRTKFLCASARVYFDPHPKEVFLFDHHAKRAKLEYSDFKQWAVCLQCGGKRFVVGDEPCFVNETMCVKCASPAREVAMAGKPNHVGGHDPTLSSPQPHRHAHQQVAARGHSKSANTSRFPCKCSFSPPTEIP